MAAAMANGGDGCVRKEERESGGGRERVESERVGLRNVRGIPSQLQALGGKQEVAMHVCARRGHTPLSSWRGGDDDWRRPISWAELLGRSGKWPR